MIYQRNTRVMIGESLLLKELDLVKPDYRMFGNQDKYEARRESYAKRIGVKVEDVKRYDVGGRLK